MSRSGDDAAVEQVAGFLGSLDAEVHALAPGRWTIALEAGGFPLAVALTVAGPLLRVQAAVLPAGVIDPHQLLFWNGQAPLVCFAENTAGEVLVTGELALAQLDTELLDRFLGLLLASATRARQFVIPSA